MTDKLSQRKLSIDNQISGARATTAPVHIPSPALVTPPQSGPQIGVLTLEAQQRAATKRPPSSQKQRTTTGRTHQVKTRLTDAELALLEARVKAAGIKQGDFIRQCLLHTEVTVRSVTNTDAQALELLTVISADLGRIGGLIRGTVVTNKGDFATLPPQSKADLESLMRQLSKTKDKLLHVVEVTYGDH